MHVKNINIVLSLIFCVVLRIVADNNCNEHIIENALNSEYFDYKFKQDSVEVLINYLLQNNCKNAETILYEFAVENTIYREYSLAAMSKAKMPSLLKFLYNYGDSIDVPSLNACLRAIGPKQPWFSDSLYNFLTKAATTHPNSAFRGSIIMFFIASARFIDCKLIMENIAIEPEKSSVIDIYRALTRFKYSQFDSIIIHELNQPKIWDIYFTVYLKRNNRYDFLPELHNLRKHMQKETNPLRKEDAARICKELETVIPYLEKKKEEKASIGLPLDWGTTSSVGKE